MSQTTTQPETRPETRSEFQQRVDVVVAEWEAEQAAASESVA